MPSQGVIKRPCSSSQGPEPKCISMETVGAGTSVESVQGRDFQPSNVSAVSYYPLIPSATPSGFKELTRRKAPIMWSQFNLNMNILMTQHPHPRHFLTNYSFLNLRCEKQPSLVEWVCPPADPELQGGGRWSRLLSPAAILSARDKQVPAFLLPHKEGNIKETHGLCMLCSLAIWDWIPNKNYKP